MEMKSDDGDDESGEGRSGKNLTRSPPAAADGAGLEHHDAAA